MSQVGVGLRSWRGALLGALALPLLTGSPVSQATGHGAVPARLMSCRGSLVSTSRVRRTSRLLALRTPREEELNGETFSVLVTGYALAPCVPGATGGLGLAAPGGHDVAVVSLVVSQSGTSRRSPDLSLVAGGRSFGLPGGTLGSVTEAVGVPAGSDVVLRASESGLAQSFSLRSGRLAGEVPEALYRSPLGPELVQGEQRRVTFETTSGRRTEAFPVVLDTVSFGEFSPAGRPAPAGDGWLDVDLLDGAGASAPDWLRVLPARRVRLVVADPPGGAVAALPVFNELGGDFAFLVPAGLVRATLVLTPGVLTVGGRRLVVAGTGRFPVVLPRPPAWLRRLEASGPRGGGGDAPSRGGSPLVVIVASTAGGSTLVVVPLLLVLPVLRRRRQRRAGPYGVAVTDEPAAVLALPFTAAPTGGSEAVSAEADGAPADRAETAPLAGPALSSRLEVKVLGPVELVGLELPTDRLAALEIICFLACHKGRRFSPDELRTSLWPLREDGREAISERTFSSYVTAARRAAGAGRFPKTAAGAYAIAEEVETDWEVFSRLLSRAKAADNAERRRLLDEALGLVRGEPFAGTPKRRYEWAHADGIVAEIAVGLREAASLLAESAAQDEVPGEALRGLGRALVATKDRDVGDDLLAAAGATGSLSDLERAWRQVTAAIGREAEALRASYEAIRRRLGGEH